jgi:hypothetical protein
MGEVSFWKRRYWRFFTAINLIGIVVGAIAGYIYYIKVGCSSGTCPITSNPYYSIAWGAAMGYLLGDMFYAKKEETKEQSTGK